MRLVRKVSFLLVCKVTAPQTFDRVRSGVQVKKMEKISLKKITGRYQLKGKHIWQVWEVKKESCFSALNFL